jgi:hypothetical protein
MEETLASFRLDSHPSAKPWHETAVKGVARHSKPTAAEIASIAENFIVEEAHLRPAQAKAKGDEGRPAGLQLP